MNRLSGVVLTQWSSSEAGAAPLLPGVLATGPLSAPPWGTTRPATAWAKATLDTVRPAAWTSDTRIELAPGFAVTVLSPGTDNPARLAEDRGLVLLFEYGEARLLYAGTVGFGIEERLLREKPDLKADVLVEGRHSAEPNLSEPWLRQVAPRDLVLIDRANPSRVHADFLTPLDDAEKPRLWDQAETGAMRIVLHAAGGATVEPWQAGAAEPEDAD